jgi:hypothetical protein
MTEDELKLNCKRRIETYWRVIAKDISKEFEEQLSKRQGIDN